MALKSTIFKARLNVADMDRNVYGDFNLTLARHPSETDQRMMLRLLAFALNADEQLEFGRGISTDEEPDLWRRELNGDIDLWIELGTPDPDRLRKACGRARQVLLYAYGDRSTSVWWDKHSNALSRHDNLAVLRLGDETLAELELFTAPGMNLQCSISEGEALLSDGERSLAIKPERLEK